MSDGDKDEAGRGGVGADIIFQCTSCGALLSVGSEEEGGAFDCPACHADQVVPRLGDAGRRHGVRAGSAGAPDATVDETSEKPDAGPGGAKGRRTVVRTPKSKSIKLKTASHALPPRDPRGERDLFREVGGPALRMLAVAAGALGFMVAVAAVVWIAVQMNAERADMLLANIVFASLFLMGLMGMLMAKLCFTVLHVALRLEYDLRHR